MKAYNKLVTLALLVALVSSAACGSNPNAPSVQQSGLKDATPEAPKDEPPTISLDSTSVLQEEVQVVAMDETGAEFDVTVDGQRPSRVRITQGPNDEAAMLTVDGLVVCLPSDPNCVEPHGIAVAAVMAAALRLYAVYEFMKGCAVPVWKDFKAGGLTNLTRSTVTSCIAIGAENVIAAKVVEPLVKAYGVTRLRAVIKSAVGSRVTWDTLRAALNKGNFKSVAEILTELVMRLSQAVYDGIYAAVRSL